MQENLDQRLDGNEKIISRSLQTYSLVLQFSYGEKDIKVNK